MAFKETEQLWSRGCEKEGGANYGVRTAHLGTKYGTGLCSVRTLLLRTSLLLLVFVMGFSQIGIIVSLLSQTKYGCYHIGL